LCDESLKGLAAWPALHTGMREFLEQDLRPAIGKLVAFA